MMKSTGSAIRHSKSRNRLLLLALGIVLLLLFCVLLISYIPGCIFEPPPPTPGALVANAGGPYAVDEAQPLTLNGSGSGGGTITNYAWDFGDGSTGSGVSPSHTYNDGPAQFTVRLTITDDQSRTAVATGQVIVNNLPPTATANINGVPYTCEINKIIQLAGQCDDPSPIDDTSLTCTWADFSGAAISQPTYTCPATPGEVTVTLTATDKDGASAQNSATISVTTTVLTPSITAEAGGPYNGLVGVALPFDGSGSQPADLIDSYTWDFGDGQSGQGVVISHTYAMTGTFNVTLTVTGIGQTDSDPTTATITSTSPITNELPTAVISQPQLCAKDGLYYRLDGSSSSDPDGGIVRYEWNFGDDQSAMGSVADHRYKARGNYTVTLTVTDDKGATGSDTESILIPESCRACLN